MCLFAYLVAVLGQLADVARVLVAYAIDLVEYLALDALGLRVARRPLGRVVVLRAHHVVERRYLHVAVQWHHFALLCFFVLQYNIHMRSTEEGEEKRNVTQ